MRGKGLKLGGVVAGFAALILALAVACGGGEPQELDIQVSVKDGEMTPKVIKVKQGDIVTLKIQSTEAIQFHLHTYDIETTVEPGTVADFFFVADATGRFRITSHHLEGEREQPEDESGDHENGEEEHEPAGEQPEDGERDIGFLEVGPR